MNSSSAICKRTNGEVWLVEKRGGWMGLYDQLSMKPCLMVLKPPVLCCYDLQILSSRKPIISVNLRDFPYSVDQAVVKKRGHPIIPHVRLHQRAGEGTHQQILWRQSTVIILEFMPASTELSANWFASIQTCLAFYHSGHALSSAGGETTTALESLRSALNNYRPSVKLLDNISNPRPSVAVSGSVCFFIAGIAGKLLRRVTRLNQAASIIQSSYRSYRQRKQYFHLLRQHSIQLELEIRRSRARRSLLRLIAFSRYQRRRRQLILAELLDTEEHYIDNITLTIRVFLRPMRLFSKEFQLNDAKIGRIFGNLEIILSYHQQLLARIKHVQQHASDCRNCDYQVISLLCQEIIGWMPHLYSAYIHNFSVSTLTLRECRRKSYALRDYLESTQQIRSLNRLDIHAFLIQPVQRLPRYRLMLNELQRYMIPLQQRQESKLLERCVRVLEKTLSN